MRYLIVALIALHVLSFAQSARSGDDSLAVQSVPNIKAPEPARSVANYSYKVVKAYPHDSQAFTQGLVYENNACFEGTGLYGKSTLRKTILKTGDVVKVHNLPSPFFGEGITVFGDKVIQLTWKSQKGFVYDKYSFQLLKTFHYATEGWGLTHDGSKLIMSDGSAHLIFLDPETFNETGRIEVSGDKGPVTGLNELEYIRGQLFANVWPTNRIVIISPSTGRVTGWINLEGLSRLSGGDNINKTLNGIAYDKENDRLFVTGKLWPWIYEIELIPLTPGP